MFSSKSILRIIFLVLILVIVSNNMMTALGQSKTSQTIRIGAALPLTGQYASYGQLIRDGIELAREDLGKSGLKIETYYEDIPTPGPAAVTAVRNLVTMRHVHGLAGNFWNGVIPAISPILMNSRIPSFHTAIADDYILNAGDYIFSTNARVKDEARELAQYAVNTLHAKTSAILYVSTNWGENYAKHYAKEFEKLGGKIILQDTTAVGDTDVRALIMRVKSQRPDVLFTAYFGTDLGTILKRIDEAHLQTPVLGTYETEDPSVIETAGSAAEGIHYFTPEAIQQGKLELEFSDRFQKHFRYEPRILARNSYDATMLLAKSLNDCSLNPECTRDKLYQIRNYSGTSGMLSIDTDGAATKELTLKTVQSGLFAVVTDNIEKDGFQLLRPRL